MKVFRKIAIMTMFLVLGGMVLAGCGNAPGNKITDNPTNGSNNSANETQTAASSDATGGSTDNSLADNSEEVIKEGTVEKNGNVVLKQLAFVYQDNAIAISDILDDQTIESILGKADEIKSHTYSEGDGLNMDQLNGLTEKQYLYPGLVIKTIDAAEDKKSFIFNIEITDPKYPTVRNIKVGDSYEKLKEAYPEGNLLGGELSDQEDDFRYEPVNYVDVMNFHIKDKKVESIQIYSLID
jgi:hypothetical protein